MNLKKDIIIVTIAVVLVGAAGYWGWYNKTPATNDLSLVPIGQPTPPEEMVGWKTYRNEKYGFELKYPPEVKIVDFSPFDYDLLLKEDSNLFKEDGIRIYLDSGTYKSFKEYKEYIKSFEHENNKKYFNLISFWEETVEDKQVFFQRGRNIGIGGPLDSYSYSMYVWIDNGKVISIHYEFYNENQYEVLNKIYHSFKLIR